MLIHPQLDIKMHSSRTLRKKKMITIHRHTLLFFSFYFPLYFLSLQFLHTDAAPVGVCYGRVATNLPPLFDAANIFKSNKIRRIRLFDSNPDTLRAFSQAGLELMIGIPNEQLPALASHTPDESIQWLRSHILELCRPLKVPYIQFGNEVFLNNPYYTPYLVPAITNIYHALVSLNLANFIKLSTPHSASVLVNSNPPSSSTFDPHLKPAMIPLLQFLHDSRSPLMINLYPYESYLRDSKNINEDYALFRSTDVVDDRGLKYNNLFDASVDAFIHAMEKEGFRGIPVVVSETGWPTSGGQADNALAYNSNVVARALKDVGTPKRPGVGLEVYLFGEFDENEKDGEEYEKPIELLKFDGAKNYGINSI